ncbi:diguanylate cyclase [Clostridium pasteurianum DSM 525 = ATCC 6013]|uniref:Diguanylate cyclase n=1 Tax=Clostridium pasteurianum DSM 525 = ATCC 6013 TaxID=1262449 RepID=A0A0H3JBA8_CLOPA|nr:tetratricopeptide repeat protein [Clostridium pasteurianum]AJA49405.1 diguanylate cyclase [Clostridium pasteurianum DSM 525 = ATCC 6013]AJA53393.1 diguanylate cyclase [Clostridium pasteurianum DSM 525 = ATCC 6013]AOZ76576.1 hypothetical protein AQ983_16225 [Clostridium pasteurianum DSM 525 = ATCC 6013]AOZ80373.1 hypothetical protein AQ984_16220 [Clostridium pasteurianum]ELP58479.1 diguanylate cyclase [Clostridium pasteurianum DSM 525 = ATCC 6013]
MINSDNATTINEILEKLDKIKYENSINTIKFGNNSYELCKKFNHTIGMAVSLLRVGEALTNIGNYEKSLSLLFESLSISRKEDICDIQVLSLIYIGNNLLNLGDYEKSFDYYNDAEKTALKMSVNKNYYSKYNYKFYLAKTSTNIGEIYKNLKDYENAFKFYNRALTFDKKLNYKSTFGVSLYNLGEMNYLSGNYDKAILLLNKSIEIMNSFNYKLVLPEVYRILALIYEKKGNFTKSNEYFCKALNIDLKETFLFYKINILLDYSDYLKNRGNLSLALDKLKIAFNISVENNIIFKTIEVCKKLFSLYEELKNDDKAYEYYKLYFKYHDKLEKVICTQRLNNINSKIKLQKLEEEKLNIMKKSENFRKRFEKLIESIKNISIISELGQKITSTLNLDKILNILCNSVRDFIDISIFGIALYNTDNEILQYNYYSENNKIINVPNASITSKSNIAAYYLRNRQLVIINDIENEYSRYVDNPNYINTISAKSAIYCPLIMDDILLGVMTVQSSIKSL